MIIIYQTSLKKNNGLVNCTYLVMEADWTESNKWFDNFATFNSFTLLANNSLLWVDPMGIY